MIVVEKRLGIRTAKAVVASTPGISITPSNIPEIIHWTLVLFLLFQ